ncbi:hypothetical protein [Erythrobacter sp. YT30]|uniref:hypothetical protein n=1 Tax=Erythrobacter sp. YT30 TaxID=1735012 RepID=UPI00076C2A77|nr:hypothetical protein [Erythrobacter sp. YT30]KWV90526.1 hypothetical protein AUC45_14930 [Erythrobacter sp. YT30]
MAEWLIEEGIGEDRAVLFENGQVVAAKIDWPGEIAAGSVIEAVYLRKGRVVGRGVARLPDGSEALIDKLPTSASEGATMRFRVKRSARRESGRSKLAQLEPTDEPCRPAPSLRERLDARRVNTLGRDVWEELRAGAWEGEMHFSGGSLQLSPTPAMTLIDIDGELPPKQLAMQGTEWIGKAIRCMDLSGSIGIDFPTLDKRSDRKELDLALGEAIGDWPHERTALNGFGFVQIVSRVGAPSLLHRQQLHREGAAARWLLRRAEQHGGGAGIMLLRAHPRVISALCDEWLDELRRRTGWSLKIERDPRLALDAPDVQIVEQ